MTEILSDRTGSGQTDRQQVVYTLAKSVTEIPAERSPDSLINIFYVRVSISSLRRR